MVRRGVIAAVALAMVGLFAAASPAAGQVAAPGGYPGPTTTAPPGPTSDEQNAGTVRAGQTIVVESCGFEPSTPSDVPAPVPVGGSEQTVSVTWNGASVGTAVVGEDGCARVSISVNERDASPPCPAGSVNDVDVAGERGRNTLVVAGEGSNGAPRNVTTRVTISCSNGGGGPGGGAGAASASESGDGGQPTGDAGVRTAETASSTRPVLEEVAGSGVLRGAAMLLLLGVVSATLVVAERVRRARRVAL